MLKDPTWEELCAANPELAGAGEDLVKAVLKETPNSFGMTPVDAFILCAEALAKMGQAACETKEKVDQFKTVLTGSSTTDETIKDSYGRVISKDVPPKPEGRRAAIEHTKRKIKNEEN